MTDSSDRLDDRRCRQILEGLPGLVWSLDADGRLDFFSPRWEELTGLPAAELLHDGWFAALPADELPRISSLWTEALRRGEPFTLEHRLRCRDGGVRRFRTRGAPRRDPAGRILGWSGSTDEREPGESERGRERLLEQARAGAAAARCSGAQLAAILEAMADGVAVFDLEGHALYLNGAEARLNGFESPEAMQRDLADFTALFELREPDGRLLPPGQWPAARVLRGESISELELRARRLDTGQAWLFSFSGEPVRDEEGRQFLAAVITRDISARHRAEEELRRSEEWRRIALDVAELGSWDYDLVSGNVNWDERFGELYGIAAEQLPYAEVLSRLVHPEDRACLDAAVQASLDPRGDGAISIEHRVTPGGAVRWVSVKGRVLFEGEGEARRAVRFVGTSADISERKRGERRLRNSEERFRQLADAMPQLVWTATPDGTVDYYNVRYKELSGIEPVAENAWRWAPVLHPEDEAATVEAWSRAVATGRPYEIAHRVRRADGSFRWHLSRGVPVRDAEGRVVKWFGTATDIDAQKRAEQALRESEERFRTLADNMDQLAWMADAQGRTSWFNQRWLDYTGLGLEQIRDGGWHRVLPPEHAEPVAGKLRRCLESGQVWEDTFPLRGRDGQHRWFLSRAVPIRDESGQVQRWFGTHTDVTEQRRIEEALREAKGRLEDADRRKNEFLAMLSHELRNPLAPIRNGVYLLERTGPADERSRRALAIIARQVRHLARLIDDLLDVTRITRGKIRLQRERLELGGLLGGVAEDQREAFVKAGIELEVRLADEPLTVDGDPTRLAQMVGNLLQNAVKFTPRGGRTTLSLAREADQAVVRVEDTGAGIAPETIEHLFQPFMQAESTLDRSRGGLGLGLALVKGLVELHGGRVGAESEGVGRGAQFTIRLPLEGREASLPVAQRTEARAAGGLRVLVIEDNRDTAESLQEVLELSGHQVEVAFTGPEGIEKARLFAPEVVLCDLGLPGMDGYAVARALRADPGLRSIYLVALSGYASPEDVERSREAGFDRHLAKPPDLDLIERMLAAGPPPAVH